MKKILLFLTIALAALTSCKDDEKSVAIKGVAADYDGTTVRLTGEEQSFVVNLSGKGWKAASPTADTWISTEPTSDGNLGVYVTRNEAEESRSSHVIVYAGKDEYRIDVDQDYYRYFTFYATKTDINTAAGEYRIPISTNLTPDEVSFSSTGSWISGIGYGDGWLTFNAEAGTGAVRSAVINVTSELVNTSIEVRQEVPSTKSYIISTAPVDLESYPVYDAYDPATNEPVARICREYLHKTNPDESVIIDRRCDVVYPYREGEIDYANGLILETGGNVSWNEFADNDTEGREVIARVTPGNLSSKTYLAYIHAGSSELTTEALSAAEEATAVICTCKPVTFTDRKSGDDDGYGNTEEVYEYSYLKVGFQYWMKENYASSRFADGTCIPTGFSNTEWAERITPRMMPMCLVSALGSKSTYIDANNPEGAATRRTYGCLYNYAAIVGQNLDVSASPTSTFDNVDRLSPEGWGVPTKADYNAFCNYVVQRNIREIGTDAYARELIDKVRSGSDYSNISGFSALGARGRAASGAYGGVLYYFTMGYSFALGSHTVSALQVRVPGSSTIVYEPLYDITILYGGSLRLIKR